MKTTPTLLRSIALVLALAFPAAHLPAARAQEDAIASMDTDGKNAFIDEVKQKPSVRDVPVDDGNMVRTGQRTSALLDLIPQGRIWLNENSAKLVTMSFFKGARCVALQLIAGELLIDGENVCFVTNVGAVSGISHSRINLKVDERGTVMTVIEGAAELDGKPASMRVAASEQLVVFPNGQYARTRLDPAAAERTADWTRNYFQGGSAKKKSKWWKKALIGVGIVAAGVAVHNANKHDDDDRDEPPPPPSPAGSSPSTTDGSAPAPGTTTTQAGDAASSPLQGQRVQDVQLPTCCVPLGGYGEQTIRTTPADCAARGGRLANTCVSPVR